jgi:dihydrofolate reductase/thymidylate synthase
MSLNCIVAVSNNYGIGLNNTLPWNISEDLAHFKELTTNNVVVMGRKTFDSLPDKHKPLKNRINIVVTRGAASGALTNVLFDNLENVKIIIKKLIKENMHVFIIGGDQIYKQFIDTYDNIYITYIDKKYECDTYFTPPSFKYSLTSYSEAKPMQIQDDIITTYRFLTYKKTTLYITDSYHCDTVYKSLSMKILSYGSKKEDRTGTGTISHFGNMIEFDISEYVPALTTKKLFWKSVIKELLWFLRGDTDATILNNQGVNIWKGNSSKEAQYNLGLGHLKEGDCGANYSFQWKHFGATYGTCNDDYTGQGIDQIAYIENLLKTDKHSRRIFLSGWNPPDLSKTVLPPCHVSCQFYVDNNDNLSCHMYQRSCDVFLGLPFNILSYTVLTYILAVRCNLKPARLCISIGDTHIYNDHIVQIKEQLQKPSFSMPRLVINNAIKSKEWKDITIDDFDLIGYFCNPAIKAKMSV